MANQRRGGAQQSTRVPKSMRSCRYCGKKFTPAGTGQRYCKPGHRTMAHRARRDSALDMLIALYGRLHVPAAVVVDVVERNGTRWAQSRLRDFGQTYDEKNRKWVQR